MTNSQSLALVVVSLGGTVTGKTNAGLLADIVRALGGTPTGNTNADLIGEIAAALGGTAGEGTNADRLKAVADALDIDASGTNAEVLAAILTGLGGAASPGDTNATLILGISEHPPAQGHTVRFHVATDSIGYGSVSPASVTGVESGAAIDATAAALTVGGEAGCTAAPEADTSEYVYAFTGWTGADDAGTAVPGTVTEDLDLYAHFSRTALYDVSFYVATDSAGYGSVSPVTIQGVPAGTAVTVAQTLVVGSAGQCVATPEADTAEWLYSFGSWTGADDASTPAAAVISADTAYYAHFSRSPAGPTQMDPSLFTYTVPSDKAIVTGWAGTPPADGYDLWLPDTDGDGHVLGAIGGGSDETYVPPWTGAASVRSDTATTVSAYAFNGCAGIASFAFPAATKISQHAFDGCTGATSVTLGPLSLSASSNAFSSWTFYDADGTTVLNKTAANLANSTFVGTASALVKQTAP